jgi:hypothetical protein
MAVSLVVISMVCALTEMQQRGRLELMYPHICACPIIVRLMRGGPEGVAGNSDHEKHGGAAENGKLGVSLVGVLMYQTNGELLLGSNRDFNDRYAS